MSWSNSPKYSSRLNRPVKDRLLGGAKRHSVLDGAFQLPDQFLRYRSLISPDRQFTGFRPKNGSTINGLCPLSADRIDVGCQLRPVSFKSRQMISDGATLVVHDHESIRSLGDEIDNDALTSSIRQCDVDRLFDMQARIAKLREGLTKCLRLLSEKLDFSVGYTAMLAYPAPQIGSD